MICFLIALFSSIVVTSGATWYASPSGSATNGTVAAPWSYRYAVTNSTGNPHLQAGDTVILQSGTFTCTETNLSQETGHILEFRRSGTLAVPITYKSETLWQAKFDGGLLLPQTISNIIIHGVHIFTSWSTNRERYSIYTHPSGINQLSQNTKIVHCLISDSGHPGIGSWKLSQGKYIAGNIIRFTGNQDHTPGQVDGQRGAGMYMQNLDNSAQALIKGNISYYNNTEGLQAYGNTDIWDFKFQDNAITLNSLGAILFHLDNYSSKGVQIISNAAWGNSDGIRLGYPLGVGGHTNGVVIGNYIVESAPGGFPYYQADGWTNNTYSNNVGVHLTDRNLFSMETTVQVNRGNPASHWMDYNAYYSTSYFSALPDPFQLLGTNYSLANWRLQVNGESNSTYQTTIPTNLDVRVHQPSYDSNFIHVTVFNWSRSNSVQVSLAGTVFSTGDRLDVYDSQNIPTAYKSEYYTGQPISLDLTLTNRVAMLGTYTERTNVWNGFDPRFRAFVINRSAYGSTQAISSTISSGRSRKSVSR